MVSCASRERHLTGDTGLSSGIPSRGAKDHERAKVLGVVLLLGLASAIYYFVTSKPPEQPPNDRVQEENFDRLQAGMTEQQVESILGAHKRVRGEVLQLERPGSADLQVTIQEQPDSLESDSGDTH